MNRIFYLDLFFATNFLMDLVALAAGALCASCKVKFWRMLLAAAFGAALSALWVCLPVGDGATLVPAALAYLGMILICFGIKKPRRLLAPGLFSLAAALFLGGAVQFLSFYLLPRQKPRLTLWLLLGAVLLALGAFSLWGRRVRQKLNTAVVSLAITFGGHCEHYFGLVDSGLLLRDPEEGRPVLLLKAEYAAPLLPRAFLKRLEQGEIAGEERLFLLPIQTVGGSSRLFAFMPDRVRVVPVGKTKGKKWEGEILVALDFSQGGFGGCPCLVPLSVL